VKKLVSEDGQTMNYNKWVKGIADREFNSQKAFLNDLFNKNTDKQNPNLKRHQNVMPYPLNNLVPTLGNSIVGLQNSLSILENLKNNPVIKKESNNVHLEESIKNLKLAAELIQKAANSVDNIDYSI
jgi:hypothetical protein